ncbi:uncharacterized protein VTP21DRAFT_5603 [Calcarisporiella thermophila]|uniref:uncharacterized protein n=1 Tax=Calcarisporiella thermophila TaxID=911321 RepID=UPI0037427EC2
MITAAPKLVSPPPSLPSLPQQAPLGDWYGQMKLALHHRGRLRYHKVRDKVPPCHILTTLSGSEHLHWTEGPFMVKGERKRLMDKNSRGYVSDKRSKGSPPPLQSPTWAQVWAREDARACATSYRRCSESAANPLAPSSYMKEKPKSEGESDEMTLAQGLAVLLSALGWPAFCWQKG